MKSKIILEDIKIYAYHGVLPEEAIIGNHYVVNLEVHSDLEKALQSDDLKDTINYAEINDIVHQEMGIRSQLLEHVIGRIITKIENQFPQITFIKIKLTKTIPPMPGEMKGVSLEFEKESSKTTD
ncbi:dihydroneopterin aldolase [Epilithonimonas xixisoli]|uniref:7,8-dihydroneopterin aldolase n=1 Tax=Epilithonimonas xixisoli TaxID=1476462 RepID=A0A4R8IF20_9FLAO|nr:dihydroneopterin aldolase [Epilithonimonas xixisoli]TDX84014.1 dihydroneopterin aldolase [Epilithonimonas xixisoli]